MICWFREDHVCRRNRHIQDQSGEVWKTSKGARGRSGPKVADLYKGKQREHRDFWRGSKKESRRGVQEGGREGVHEEVQDQVREEVQKDIREGDHQKCLDVKTQIWNS